MGRSHTIHCIGLAVVEEGRQRMFSAMSRLEMAQETEKAKREGLIIVSWYAQTETGCRILGDDMALYYTVKASDVPQVKGLITCDVCSGNGCPVCRYSGVTVKKEKTKYLDWQLKRFREEHGERGKRNTEV